MQLPLTLALRGSRRLDTLLVCVHSLAAGSLLVVLLPWPIRLVLLGLVTVSVFFCLDSGRRHVAALHLGARGDLEVTTKLGARETVAIEPHTILLPGLIVLILRQGGRRRVMPLLADALEGDSFRQLRLWLRWRARLPGAVSASV